MPLNVTVLRAHVGLTTAVTQSSYVRQANVVRGAHGVAFVGDCPSCRYISAWGTWMQAANRVAMHIWYAQRREQRQAVKP